MNGNGYSALEKVSVAPFTKEQRQRLEAVTAAKSLFKGSPVYEVLEVADYIATGKR